jgi:hypothetical protein
MLGKFAFVVAIWVSPFDVVSRWKLLRETNAHRGSIWLRPREDTSSPLRVGLPNMPLGTESGLIELAIGSSGGFAQDVPSI